MLAHGQVGVQLQGLFCKLASQQDGTQHLLLPQAVLSQVKDLALPLVERHEVISWDRKESDLLFCLFYFFLLPILLYFSKSFDKYYSIKLYKYIKKYTIFMGNFFS